MLCVLDHSPCEIGCPYRYPDGSGCFWADNPCTRRAAVPDRVCPHCGASLDPEEVCDCMKNGAPGAGTPESAD